MRRKIGSRTVGCLRVWALAVAIALAAPAGVPGPVGLALAEGPPTGRGFYNWYRRNLAELMQEADELRADALRFPLPPFYCIGSTARESDEKALGQLARRFRELRTRYNNFKAEVDRGKVQLISLNDMRENGADPASPRFWTAPDNQIKAAGDAVAAKQIAQQRIPNRDCARRPGTVAPPPPPANPLAGFTRPAPCNLAVPPAPTTFCSEADRYKWLIDVWGPLITAAGKCLQEATSYDKRIAEAIVALNRLGRDAEADPLRREGNWAGAEAARRRELFDQIDKLRGAAYRATIIDCGPRTAAPTGPGTPGQPPPPPAEGDRRVGIGAPPREGFPPRSPYERDIRTRVRTERVIRYSFFADAGVQFDEFKPTSLGTLFVPGADRPFLFSRGSATGFNVGLNVRTQGQIVWPLILPLFGQNGATQESLAFGFTFSRTWSSVSGSSGPGDMPFFTLVEPFAGVQSFGIGPIDASIKSSVNTMSVYLNDKLQLDEFWTIYLGMRFQRTEIEHDGRINSRVLPGFTINQVVSTNDNYFGPVFGAKYMTPLPFVIPGTNIQPILDINGWLSPSLRISDGSVRQHVVIPGAAPPFDNFAVRTSDTSVGFALLGGVNAGLSANITPNISARLSGGFRFNTAQNAFEMPVSPGQRARFDTDFHIRREFRFSVGFRF